MLQRSSKVCGHNQENAEWLCNETFTGKVVNSPALCSDESIPEPWEPSEYVYADPDGNERTVIEGALLDRLEASPGDIYLDATRVDQHPNGRVFISTTGELSAALGLALGDELLEVNGYPSEDILDIAELYPRLREEDELELSFERRGEILTALYEIR